MFFKEGSAGKICQDVWGNPSSHVQVSVGCLFVFQLLVNSTRYTVVQGGGVGPGPLRYG